MPIVGVTDKQGNKQRSGIAQEEPNYHISSGIGREMPNFTLFKDVAVLALASSIRYSVVQVSSCIMKVAIYVRVQKAHLIPTLRGCMGLEVLTITRLSHRTPQTACVVFVPMGGVVLGLHIGISGVTHNIVTEVSHLKRSY